jgi:hypothetical protein
MSQSEKSGWIVVLIAVSALGVLAAIIALKQGGDKELGAKGECIHNLRSIDGAKKLWALENKKAAGTKVTEAELRRLQSKQINTLPVCPQGGSYTLGAIGENPRCSVPGHALP